jgi:hypothetical protein
MKTKSTPEYILKRFKNNSAAHDYADAMKAAYGFKPSVFKETDDLTKKFDFVVVKPRGLRKL